MRPKTRRCRDLRGHSRHWHSLSRLRGEHKSTGCSGQRESRESGWEGTSERVAEVWRDDPTHGRLSLEEHLGQKWPLVTTPVTSNSLEFHSARDDTDLETVRNNTVGPSEVLIQHMCGKANNLHFNKHSRACIDRIYLIPLGK